MTTLDRWDYMLIRHFKETNAPYDPTVLCHIWAERCGLMPDYVHLCYVVERVANIVDSFNPIPLSELMERMSPTKGFRLNLPESAGYWERWLAMLGCHICLTDHKLLPGYSAWVRAERLALTSAPTQPTLAQ